MEDIKSYYGSENQGNFYQGRIPREEGLLGVSQLLRESWKIYRQRIKILLGIWIIPVGFSLFFNILIYFLEKTDIVYSIWFSAVGAISYFGSAFLLFWASPSLIYSIKDNTSIKESYQKGWKMFFPYIWVYILSTAIVLGGALLFVLPGILFLIWFSFSIFVLIFEEKKGFASLFGSKQLILSNFWKILWRFLILFLIMIILSIISALLFANREPTNGLEFMGSYFLQLFSIPFFLIYLTLVYKDLRKIKEKECPEKISLGRKIKYAIPGFLGLALICSILTFLMLNLFLGRDCYPPDDSDLWLPKIEISEKDNANYSFSQATEHFNLPDERSELFINISEGKEWDSDFAKTLIEKNQEVFDYLQEGLIKDQFVFPGWEDPKEVWIGSSMISLRGFLNIAKLNSIKAYYLFEEGKQKEAMERCIQTVKFGDMIEDSRNLISYLVGFAVKKQGLECLRIIVSDSILTSEDLKNYIGILGEFSNNKEALKAVFKMEYIALINTKEKIDAVYAGNAPEEDLEMLGMEEFSLTEYPLLKLNYFYKPNRTKKMFVDYSRLLVANIDEYYNDMEFPEITILTPESKFKMLFTENFIGKIMHDIIMTSISGTLARSCEEEFLVKGTQLLMAMKAYKIEKGALPSSLSDLVPEYISEVYRDPFDGEEIRYNSRKGLIYSIGKDLIDFGGSEEDLDNIKEPTLKINF